MTVYAVYAVETDDGRIGLFVAPSAATARGYALRTLGGTLKSVRRATSEDVARVPSMGGHVPQEAQP